MKKEAVILIAEDDDGHASLIRRNLQRSGIQNQIVHLKDGQETMDYLLQNLNDMKVEQNKTLLLLLDINMPKIDGIEVLRQVKAHPQLQKIPIIMITTTDDPREVERCHALGCNTYITKPIDYEKFSKAINQLGLFLLVVEIPTFKNGEK